MKCFATGAKQWLINVMNMGIEVPENEMAFLSPLPVVRSEEQTCGCVSLCKVALLRYPSSGVRILMSGQRPTNSE